MSWPQRQEQSNGFVTAETLEERINMYISAMDKATALNNGHEFTQLQQDIQRLVDLMERITAGQLVTEQEVPPPLVITPQIDVLANPLGELSSRLAEYHKALYFAEEELSEDRMNKIQKLQRGLQIIHGLQKRAQAGFPVRADEIPPPVIIPNDDEFDPDAVNTLTSRLAIYRAALSSASQSENDRRRMPKLQSFIRTAEFLLTRAKAKRPVWKKDIPPEFEYCVVEAHPESQPMNKAKFTLMFRSLLKRVQNITFSEAEQQKRLDELMKKLQDLDGKLPGIQPSAEIDNRLKVFTKEVETLEKMAFDEKTKDLNTSAKNLDLIELRINEYKAAALTSKRNGQVSHAIQHFKVIKGLVALKEALEKGESVDMTLVPPPPRDYTPTSESPPSLTELNQDLATTDVTQNTQGATAHLSPVIIKPAVESAEDKLAKKLFSYLDKGVDVSMSTSKQMLNIHNVTAAAAQTKSLPKIQNMETEKDNIFKASSYNDIGSVANENNSVTSNKENHTEKVVFSSLESFEDKPFASITDDQKAENEQNFTSETESLSKSLHEQGGSEQQAEESKVETVLQTNTPSFPLSKSSDIYVRKTLDSVGFLSCQNVPDHLPQSKEVFVPNNTKTVENGHSSSKSDALWHQDIGVDTVNGISPYTDKNPLSGYGLDFSQGELSSHDFTKPLVQANQADTLSTSATVKLLSNNSHIETVPGELFDYINTSEYSQSSRNDSSSVDQSAIALPTHSSDVYSDNNGPSSLPVTLMPKTLANFSVGSNTQFSSDSMNHIPDTTITPSLLETAIDSSQHLTNGKRQESAMDHNVEINISRNTVPNSEEIGSKQDERNGRTSPDSLEFLELMDSMVMSSITAPISLTHTTSSAIKLLSHENEPSLSVEPSLSGLTQIVISDKTYHNEVIDLHSKKFDSSEQASSKENNCSIDPSFMSSYTLPSGDDMNEDVANGEEKINMISTSKNVLIPSSLTQDHIYNKSSMSASYLPEVQQHVTNITDFPASSHSRVLDQNFKNVMNESLPITSAPNSQLSYQGQNLTEAASTQSSVRLPKSQSMNAARPANVFAYCDVAFTCLENLKYDCLLCLAKATDESKHEEKKLRVKFELIKNKLQNGGKRTWEVYKACVEREHASLIQQIEDLHLLQQWGDVQLLSEKKRIAERELEVLRERLPKLKY